MGIQCDADGNPCSDGGYQILEMWRAYAAGPVMTSAEAW